MICGALRELSCARERTRLTPHSASPRLGVAAIARTTCRVSRRPARRRLLGRRRRTDRCTSRRRAERARPALPTCRCSMSGSDAALRAVAPRRRTDAEPLRHSGTAVAAADELPRSRPRSISCSVPLLGFDRRGHRLGTGGGYYDRSVRVSQRGAPARLSPFWSGSAYSFPRTAALLPRKPWDSAPGFRRNGARAD
jgi:5-formyltetrahydrofolate cyclo-ligase